MLLLELTLMPSHEASRSAQSLLILRLLRPAFFLHNSNQQVRVHARSRQDHKALHLHSILHCKSSHTHSRTP